MKLAKTIIDITDISKNYGTKKVLQDVSFALPKGAICAVLGKEGAGKSTFLSLLSGLSKVSSGTINRVNYQNISTEIKQSFLSEKTTLYTRWSGYTQLQYWRRCKGASEADLLQILEELQLTSVIDAKIENLSQDNKKKLTLAGVLMGAPEILVLDEPFKSLKQESCVLLRKVLLRLNYEKNTTIIIATRDLTEVASLASNFAFLRQGRLVEYLSKVELKAKELAEIVLDTKENIKACALLERELGIYNYLVSSKQKILIREEYEVARIVEMLVRNHIGINECYLQRLTMAEYYERLVF